MRTTLLLSPYRLDGMSLDNRIVMAPMTRARVPGPAFAPTATTAEYYAQRASAGLIVSEGIAISPQARGYCNTPGLYNFEQEAAWKHVTGAVHRQGGRIFAQLWHCGRVSHVSVHQDGAAPVGPGTIGAESRTLGCDPLTGKSVVVDCSPPRALTVEEVEQIGDEFARAAGRAMAADFDGVEIHAADGYLLDQFRCPFLNHRLDRYGGSQENRCRLLLESCSAVAAVIGAARVGVRLSPLGIANDMRFDPEPETTYGYIARELGRQGILYLHLNDQDGSWIHHARDPLLLGIRRRFPQTLILCGGFDGERAEAALRAGTGDLIAFGRLYVSNPDLAERLGGGLALAPYDPKTFYRDGSSGYVDYPPAKRIPANPAPNA